jgi:hypothetical protein
MRRQVFASFAGVTLISLLAGALNSPATAVTPYTIVAVGDIAFVNDSPSAPQRKTAALASALNPDRLLLVGDLAYSDKKSTPTTLTEFNTKLKPAWNGLLSKSWAVPGNHETYGSGRGLGYRSFIAGYKSYGMPQPTKAGDLWWSKKITVGQTTWLVLGLDSEGLLNSAKRTRESNFIKAKLAANPGKPTIVMWHRPRYTSGEHGNQTDVGVKMLWNAVKSDNDVVLVLWGHDHDFESRAVNVAGRSKPLQTLVVGTGGAELRSCPGKSDPVITSTLVCGSVSGDFVNYGVVKLTLSSTGYTWEYRQVGTGGSGTIPSGAQGNFTFN